MPIDNDGSAILPSFAMISERSLGVYRSGASAVGLSYGQFQMPAGTALQPSFAYSSESSLGFYRSAASTIAQSYGTIQLPAVVVGGTTTLQYLTFGQAGVSQTGGPQWQSLSGARIVDMVSSTLRFLNIGGAAVVATLDNNGSMTLSGPIEVPAGTALAPGFAISSESSLGWYRSASSTLALSYGTLDFTAAILSVGSLKVKAGANQSCGTAVLGSNGSVNVANTYVKTGDLIFLTDQTPGGTLGDLELTGIRNSSGFTIASTSVTDTSTVAWLIIRPG